jgi:hypothetical protein
MLVCGLYASIHVSGFYGVDTMMRRAPGFASMYHAKQQQPRVAGDNLPTMVLLLSGGKTDHL